MILSIRGEVVTSRCQGSKVFGWQQTKTSLKKVNSHCFKLHRSYLISFNLSNVGKIFRVKSERTLCKFRKRKIKFLCCAHLLHKRAREIRKFHIAVVQQRLRNVQKCVMHVQRCFIAVRRRRCKNSLFLSPRNFATMVTWRHTSPLYFVPYSLCMFVWLIVRFFCERVRGLFRVHIFTTEFKYEKIYKYYK